jgi:hypothetical protein
MTTQKVKQKPADIADKAENQKSANEEKVEIYLSKTVQLLPGAEPLKPGSHSLIESAANELIESGLAVSKETVKSEAEE